MRRRNVGIIVGSAVVATVGAGVALTAGPGSSAHAQAGATAASAPQIFETIDNSPPTLPNSGQGRPYAVKLALPAGTFDVDVSGVFNEWDIKIAPGGRSLILAESERCTLASPGREAQSAGSGPVYQGVFSVNDHATIALTTGATLTFTCFAADASSSPGDLVSSTPRQMRISATKISDAATPATIGTTPVRTVRIPTASLDKLVRSSIASDTKKLNTILSQVKKQAGGK